MTFLWLNPYLFQYGLYCACCGKKTLFWSTGRSFADLTSPVCTHRAFTICCLLMPLNQCLTDVLLVQGGMSLRAPLDVDVLPRERGSGLHRELAVLVQVRDLDLRLRRHDLDLAGLQCLEDRRGARDVAEDDPVELRRRPRLEPWVLDERELLSLRPALEPVRATRKWHRVQPHVVEVSGVLRVHDRLDLLARHELVSRRCRPRRRPSCPS